MMIWCLLFGPGLLFFSIGILLVNSRVKKWPTTRAKITHAEMARYARRLYKPVMHYTFEVNGVEVSSSRVYKFFEEGFPYARCEERMKEILLNPIVRYNPVAPSDCCLTLVRFGGLQIFFLVLGSIVTAFGLSMLLVELILAI